MFQQELEELLNRIPDSEAKQQAEELRDYDFSNYILHCLRAAGIRGDDQQQEHFHEIAIRLLVQPGKLFHWNPEKHGPLIRRFKAATWNAVRNIVAKNRNRRKWMQTTDPVAMAERHPSKEADSTVIDVFRRLVRQRLGELALQILDQRLSGKETNKLVGIGTVSAFYIKQKFRPSRTWPNALRPRLATTNLPIWFPERWQPRRKPLKRGKNRWRRGNYLYNKEWVCYWDGFFLYKESITGLCWGRDKSWCFWLFS